MLATCDCIWGKVKAKVEAETKQATAKANAKTTLHTHIVVLVVAFVVIVVVLVIVVVIHVAVACACCAGFCANEFVYFVKCQLLLQQLLLSESRGGLRGQQEGGWMILCHMQQWQQLVWHLPQRRTATDRGRDRVWDAETCKREREREEMHFTLNEILSDVYHVAYA